MVHENHAAYGKSASMRKPTGGSAVGFGATYEYAACGSGWSGKRNVWSHSKPYRHGMGVAAGFSAVAGVTAATVNRNAASADTIRRRRRPLPRWASGIAVTCDPTIGGLAAL